MATFNYTVDDEAQSTEEHVLTPVQIMQKADVNPDDHYLVQIKGDQQEVYKDKPDEKIHMHNHMKFVTVYTGETKVSDVRRR